MVNVFALLLVAGAGALVSLLPVLCWYQGVGLGRQLWMNILGHLIALPVLVALLVVFGHAPTDGRLPVPSVDLWQVLVLELAAADAASLTAEEHLPLPGPARPRLAWGKHGANDGVRAVACVSS